MNKEMMVLKEYRRAAALRWLVQNITAVVAALVFKRIPSNLIAGTAICGSVALVLVGLKKTTKPYVASDVATAGLITGIMYFGPLRRTSITVFITVSAVVAIATIIDVVLIKLFGAHVVEAITLALFAITMIFDPLALVEKYGIATVFVLVAAQMGAAGTANDWCGGRFGPSIGEDEELYTMAEATSSASFLSFFEFVACYVVASVF